MSERGRPTAYRPELHAAALTQIHLGVAMAKARGVICGSPRNVRLKPFKVNYASHQKR